MEDFIKKIGIYDFFVLLGSGGIMLLVLWITNFTCQIISQDIINQLLTGLDTTILIIILVLVSVLIGVIFQELSNLIANNLMLSNDALLHEVFNYNSCLYKKYTINEEQKRNIVKRLNIKFNENNSDEIIKAEVEIFHMCKYIYKNKYDSFDLDHNQALSSMSRSLSLFFLVLTVCLAFICRTNPSIGKFVLILLFFVLSVLFYERYKRFGIIRYAEIIKKVLYTYNISY